MSRVILCLLVPCVAVVSLSCRPRDAGSGGENARAADEPVAERPGGEGALPPAVFVDASTDWGLDFVHQNGATERRYLPETMGSGVAVFDYDDDGRPDVYLVNGGRVASGQPAAGRLYRNLGGGRFEDVTARAGLDRGLIGMGVAVGDVDNDGDDDLFVGGVGGDLLFRNLGDGSFDEVGASWGLDAPGRGESHFSTSAAFVDVDRDGFLDLFVGRYVEWTVDDDVVCRPDGVHASYCTPELYGGAPDRFYRNARGRRFEESTRASGLYEPEGKTLGVVSLDFDRDGWPDLAVANDTTRNALHHNRGDGTFEEVGIESGIAFGPSGSPRGGMGIDAGDLTGDGLVDLVIGNFSQEMSAIFRGSEQGLFFDEASRLGLGLPSLMTLAFGALVIDFDGDSHLDVMLLNGHIEPEIDTLQPQQSYAQRPALYRNTGDDGRLEAVVPAGALLEPMVGRGLASGDLDGDGDLDLIATQNGRRALALRNESERRPWLGVHPVGERSNRDGYGLELTVSTGDRSFVRTLSSGRSYLSASDPRLWAGLGSLAVDSVDLAWPSGLRLRLERPPVQRWLLVREPAGAR